MSIKTQHFTNPKVAEDARFLWIEEGVEKIPYAFAKKYRMIPIFEQNGSVVVAATPGYSLEAVEDLHFYLKTAVEIWVACDEKIDRLIESCYNKNGTFEVNQNLVEQNAPKEGYDLLEQKNLDGVIKILDSIFIEAITQKASDIHFEPNEASLIVRFRIDGVLQHRRVLYKSHQDELIARIKVLSSLDIAQTRLPQDGRMKLFFGEREIDFRVSSVPVVYGERLVLRILDKKNIVLGLDSIGMPEEILQKMRLLLKKTQGIILVTGPTGSGKTTTLYSSLKELDSNAVNIMTIEDPVEYKLAHMAQIGVNPKIDLTFSTGLKHILRQDPDVIMVGEIRDKQTAEIAIQASLTGHLVLSTLHTNDALSAPTRLIDMGIEPFLIQSSLVAVLAQRLVRVMCPSCKEPYIPSKDELRQLGFAEDINYCFYHPKGCSECFGVGYKGRVGIYELLVSNSNLKSLFQIEADYDTKLQAAKNSGFRTLKEQGIDLILNGVTSCEELLRVTGAVDT